ncbi:MAG: MoaD/ThiS family protein [Thermoplasmata archaeon]|nr:MoaD/ThiS family protein [Thermoplasmata archaeon]
MHIKVYYYGIYAKIVKKESEIIEFDGKTLNDLKEFLFKKYPELLDTNPIISANFKTNNKELDENDEIIVMAPGPGG